MPGFLEFLTGKPQSVQQISRFDPQQQEIYSQLLSQLQGNIGQQSFSGIENEARRGFNQNTVPTILERLTSMGGGRSSAVGQQLGAAGADLESQLAGQRGQFNQNQLRNLLGMQSVENIIMPEQQGFLQALLTALGGGLGMGAGYLGQRGLSGLFGGGQQLQQSPRGSVVAYPPNTYNY